MKDTWESASAKTDPDTVCIGLESTQTSNVLLNHAQHANVTTQEPQQPLQPTLAPECPWQLLSTDYFHFDGSEYLVVMDYYSKMPMVRRIPASQCNASKTISVLKELFTEHGIPEVLHTDNGPSLPMHSSLQFATDWKFDHNTRFT